jgi:two-component system cell cycle sensor histidine kinase/response regulator CckA
MLGPAGVVTELTAPGCLGRIGWGLNELGEMSEAAIDVLLIDGDRNDYLLARAALATTDARRFQLTYLLRWAPGAEAARHAMAGKRPDVCLLDQRLPEGDGVTLLQSVLAEVRSIPFIVLTSEGDTILERRALAAGAADHLVKGHLDAATLERSLRLAIERGRTLATLAASERQFRSVFDSALDAMLIADDSARYVDGNAAALSLFGVSLAELRGKHVVDFAPPERRAQVERDWALFRAEGSQAGQFQLRRPDGQLRILQFTARANIVPGRHLYTLRDVTESRRADEMRSRLAAIVESSDEAIDGISLEGDIDYWSPAAERVYGYSGEETLGRSKTLLVPPEHIDELNEILVRVRRGESVRNFETVRRRKDGTLFEAMLTISPTRLEGRIIGASIITRDISEKKQLEARLAVADRMASVGTLAAGVAHEINNPLAAVMANLDFVSRELTDPRVPGPVDPVMLATPVDEARAAAERIRQIVRDLKLFSRPDEQRRGPVDVRRVMESSLRMVWNEVRHRARLVKDYRETPPTYANEARLGQVFLNLVVNAAQAIPEGNAANNEIRVVTRTGDDGRAVIEVSDTGEGMPPRVAKRIFEPFFTTKLVGIGTGLGLSICQRIVHELGGSIEVDSAIGKGTTFRVSLPPGRPALEDELRAAPTLPQPSARRGRILVVDDEPAIGKAVQRVLALDHDVVSTTSAVEAQLRIGRGERFDVIFLDLMMPQVTGQELYEALCREAPEQASAVVFLTGGAFTPAARRFLDQVPNQRIDKPFDAFHVRAVVNTFLTGGATRTPP